jgi:hypothetical protein
MYKERRKAEMKRQETEKRATSGIGQNVAALLSGFRSERQ